MYCAILLDLAAQMHILYMFLFCPLCSTNSFEPLEHIKVNVSPLATHGEALPSHHLLQRRSSEASTGGASIIRTPKTTAGSGGRKVPRRDKGYCLGLGCRAEPLSSELTNLSAVSASYASNNISIRPCPPPTRRRVHCQLISMTSSGGELAGLGFFLITKHIRSLRVSR